MSKNQFVLVTNDTSVQSSVESVIGKHPRHQMSHVCQGLDELLQRLDNGSVNAAFVDIDPQPEEMMAALDKIVPKFSATKFVVLSSALNDDLVIQAMQVGARNFIRKDSIATKIENVLDRLVPEDSNPAAGRLTTVMSVSGGCGSTTVAVNLAHELETATEEPVLLVDLDGMYGAVAGYLDLSGRYSVTDVLSSTNGVDPELVRSTALHYSDHLDVLISPASVNLVEPEAIDFSKLEPTLTSFREAYSHTVIDAPRVSLDTATTLSEASTLTYIVFQLSVKDVRLASTLCTALVDRGIASDRIVGIANRFRRRHHMVNLTEARSALRGIRVEPISNDFRASSLAINYGQPLAKVAPKSPLRRDLEKQSLQLAGTDHQLTR